MHTDASAASALGLDAGVRACLFDLDGVLSGTAAIRAEAWKKTFDTFLRAYDVHSMRRDRPFDAEADFAAYLDGRSERDGIPAFLGSREIEVPEGDADDAPGTETVHGIAAAQRWAFLSLLEARGPRVQEGSVRFAWAARGAGLPCAVVCANGNAAAVLEAAGIAELFQTVVDGNAAAAHGLQGRPAPDCHLFAARALGVEPAHAAAFESSVAGVIAARAGGFGTVVGVDRLGGEQAARLSGEGASPVVADLADLLAPSESGRGCTTESAVKT